MSETRPVLEIAILVFNGTLSSSYTVHGVALIVLPMGICVLQNVLHDTVTFLEITPSSL